MEIRQDKYFAIENAFIKDKMEYNNWFEWIVHKVIWIVIILILLFGAITYFSSDVLAVNENGFPRCDDTQPVIEVPCVMITVPVNCSVQKVSIYNSQNVTVVDNVDMAMFRDDQYYFNLTLGSGKYIINACDGLIMREVTLEEVNMLWIIYLILAVSTLLWIVSYATEELSYGMLGAFMLSITGLYMLFNGIDGQTDWLITSFSWVIFGCGTISLLITGYFYLKKVD